MTVVTLADSPSHQVDKWDVCAKKGSCQDESGKWYVRHVGLSAGQAVIQSTQSIPLVHVEPPLTESPCEIHWAGSICLTADERNNIDLFIETQKPFTEITEIELVRDPSKYYTIYPHLVEFEGNSQVVYSCAGYVLEAYRSAGIILLEYESSKYPGTTLDELYSYDAQWKRLLANKKRRSALGLVEVPQEGTEKSKQSWSIVLPGHILHSLKRCDSSIRKIPFRPKPEHAFYG